MAGNSKNKSRTKNKKNRTRNFTDSKNRTKTRVRIGRNSTITAAPQAYGGTATYAGPNQGSVWPVQHREQVGGITCANTYHHWANECSPANPNLFTWLSEIAHNFGKYKFDQMSVDYKPKCSSTTQGRIGMAFIPDPDIPVPGNFQELMSVPGAKASSVWEPLSLNVPPDMLKGIVRDGIHYVGMPQTVQTTVGGNSTGFIEDLFRSTSKTPGRLCVATDSGAGAASTVGDLLINVAGKLFNAVLPAMLATHDKVRDTAPASTTFLSNVTSHQTCNGLNMTGEYDPATRTYTLTFIKPGRYVVSCNVVVVGTTHTAVYTTAASTATVANFQSLAPVLSSTNASCIGRHRVDVSESGQTFAMLIPLKNAAGTDDSLMIEVYRLSSNYTVF